MSVSQIRFFAFGQSSYWWKPGEKIWFPLSQSKQSQKKEEIERQTANTEA